MNYNIIVAVCEDNGIGKNNMIPWNRISEDMKQFSKLTRGNGNNAIIMGKNTYNSIGKTLPNRTNIVLSTSLCDDDYNNINIFNTIEKCIKFCEDNIFDEVWIIGGELIYKQFMKINKIKYIYQTKIYDSYECDTFFPEIPLKYNIKKIESLRKNNPKTMLLIWEINPIKKYGINMRHNISFQY